MPIGDFHHHHTLYIMYASRFKSPKNQVSLLRKLLSSEAWGLRDLAHSKKTQFSSLPIVFLAGCKCRQIVQLGICPKFGFVFSLWLFCRSLMLSSYPCLCVHFRRVLGGGRFCPHPAEQRQEQRDSLHHGDRDPALARLLRRNDGSVARAVRHQQNRASRAQQRRAQVQSKGQGKQSWNRVRDWRRGQCRVRPRRRDRWCQSKITGRKFVCCWWWCGESLSRLEPHKVLVISVCYLHGRFKVYSFPVWTYFWALRTCQILFVGIAGHSLRPGFNRKVL